VTAIAHELSGVEADAIVADLGLAGIPVVVRMHDKAAHLYPQRACTTSEEVDVLRAVSAKTDAMVWHKAVVA
jgi:hypothetical protein